MDAELAYNATTPVAVDGVGDGEVTAQERLVVGMVLLSFVVILLAASSVGLWFFRVKAKKEKRGKVGGGGGGGGGARGLHSGCDDGSSTWDVLSTNPLASPAHPGRRASDAALEHGESEVMFPPLRRSQVSRRVSLGGSEVSGVTTPARLFGSGGGVQPPGSMQSSAVGSRSLHASMLIPDISFDFAAAAGKLDVTSDNSSTRFGASELSSVHGGGGGGTAAAGAGTAAAGGAAGAASAARRGLRPSNSSPTRACESPVPGLRLSSPPMKVQQQQQQQQTNGAGAPVSPPLLPPQPSSPPQPDAPPSEAAEAEALAAPLQFDAPPPRRPSKSSQVSGRSAAASSSTASTSPSHHPQAQPGAAPTAGDPQQPPAPPPPQLPTEESPASPVLAIQPAAAASSGRRQTLNDSGIASEDSVNSASSNSFGSPRPGASVRGRKSPRASKRPPLPLVLFSDDGRRLSSTSQGVLTADVSAPPEVQPLVREPDHEDTPQRPQPYPVVLPGGGELKDLVLGDLAAISRASSRRGSGSMSGSNATPGTPGTPATPLQ